MSHTARTSKECYSKGSQSPINSDYTGQHFALTRNFLALSNKHPKVAPTLTSRPAGSKSEMSHILEWSQEVNAHYGWNIRVQAQLSEKIFNSLLIMFFFSVAYKRRVNLFQNYRVL